MPCYRTADVESETKRLRKFVTFESGSLRPPARARAPRPPPTGPSRQCAVVDLWSTCSMYQIDLPDVPHRAFLDGIVGKPALRRHAVLLMRYGTKNCTIYRDFEDLWVYCYEVRVKWSPLYNPQ